MDDCYDKMLAQLIRGVEEDKSTPEFVGETILRFATPKDRAQYDAERAFVAELMKAVRAAEAARQQSPHLKEWGKPRTIAPVSESSDVPCLTPEVVEEIRAAHRSALAQRGLDMNLFDESQMRTFLVEAAWLIDSICRSARFTAGVDRHSNIVIIPKDAAGNLLRGRVYREPRMRVILGWFDASDVSVKLEVYLGYLAEAADEGI